MKIKLFLLLLILVNCSSEKVKENSSLEDTSYEIQFSPCICKRTEMVVQAKKTILSQGLKDYETFTEQKLEPELEKEIVEDNYEHFLYDFSIGNKENGEVETFDKEIISAKGSVNQKKLNGFVENYGKVNRPKPTNSNYGSKGLEVIKGFQSDRKKRQTIGELSKSRPITLYEIKKK